MDNLLFININIGMELNYCIQCGEIKRLGEKDKKLLEKGGVCIVIYKSLRRFIDLGFYDFLAHKIGDCVNNDLVEIEGVIRNNKDYFKNL